MTNNSFTKVVVLGGSGFIGSHVADELSKKGNKAIIFDKRKLKGETFNFNSEEKFKIELEKYLEEGKFYKCKKDNSRDYFINYNTFINKNKDKLLYNALSQLSYKWISKNFVETYNYNKT